MVLAAADDWRRRAASLHAVRRSDETSATQRCGTRQPAPLPRFSRAGAAAQRGAIAALSPQPPTAATPPALTAASTTAPRPAPVAVPERRSPRDRSETADAVPQSRRSRARRSADHAIAAAAERLERRTREDREQHARTAPSRDLRQIMTDFPGSAAAAEASFMSPRSSKSWPRGRSDGGARRVRQRAFRQ